LSNLKYNTIFYSILFSLFFISISISYRGCSKNNIIGEKKFVDVYIALVIAQDTASNIKSKQFREEVFKKYGVSENQYKNTLKYYNEKPQRWQKFFDKVIAQMEKLKKEAK